MQIVTSGHTESKGSSSITKTYLYNIYPLQPNFCIVKLGFTEVYIIFLIFAKNMDCGYSLKPPRTEFVEVSKAKSRRKYSSLCRKNFVLDGRGFCWTSGNTVERQLIHTFADGLVNNEQLKLKILRDNPDTLQGAISFATKEQNLRARVNFSSSFHPPYKSERRDEPLELDHYRPLKCHKCHELGHTKKNCKSVNSSDDKTGASNNKRIKNKMLGMC